MVAVLGDEDEAERQVSDLRRSGRGHGHSFFSPFGGMALRRTREELIADCAVHGHAPYNTATLRFLEKSEARLTNPVGTRRHNYRSGLPRSGAIGHYALVAEVGEDEVGAVIAWLAAHGFEKAASRESQSFGNRCEDWQRGTVRFRAVRDRGQWFVLVGNSDWEDWFDIDLVTYVCEFKDDTALDRVKAASEREMGHLLAALQSARRQIAADAFGVLQRHGVPEEPT
jgi:hypothetical protein